MVLSTSSERATAAPAPEETSAEAQLGLTRRELEVLRLLAEGLSNAQIGERLFISPRTVGQHLRSVYNKVDVSSRTAAARIAIDQGIV